TRREPIRGDQPTLLVEAERRGGDAAPPRDLSDRQQAGHEDQEKHVSALTSSSLELVAWEKPPKEGESCAIRREQASRSPPRSLLGRAWRPARADEASSPSRSTAARSGTYTATTRLTSASRRRSGASSPSSDGSSSTRSSPARWGRLPAGSRLRPTAKT